MSTTVHYVECSVVLIVQEAKEEAEEKIYKAEQWCNCFPQMSQKTQVAASATAGWRLSHMHQLAPSVIGSDPTTGFLPPALSNPHTPWLKKPGAN